MNETNNIYNFPQNNYYGDIGIPWFCIGLVSSVLFEFTVLDVQMLMLHQLVFCWETSVCSLPFLETVHYHI